MRNADSFKKLKNTLLKLGLPTPDFTFRILHHLGLKFLTKLRLNLSHLNNMAHALSRSSHQRCSVIRGVLRNFVKFKGKHLCQSLFFNKVVDLNFIKKETLEQVFSCEFYKISKKTFFYRILPVTASVSTCKKLGYFTDFFWRYDGLKNPAICWLRTLAHISETKIFSNMGFVQEHRK